MLVYIVINMIGGLVDDVDTFSQEKDAKQRFRELVYKNSPWTPKDIKEEFSVDEKGLNDVWQKDSYDYLYDEHNDLYYPLCTDEHDVYVRVSNVDGK